MHKKNWSEQSWQILNKKGQDGRGSASETETKITTEFMTLLVVAIRSGSHHSQKLRIPAGHRTTKTLFELFTPNVNSCEKKR